MPTATALCRRFAAFLFCAASTQGSYSEDFAWHDVVRWPCYKSKSRARELARASQPVMRHAARLQHHCQGNSPSPPPCALRRRAVSQHGEDPRFEGRAAGGLEPSQPEREGSQETHPTRFASGAREFNIWATKASATQKIVLAGVPRETSQALVKRNFLNTNRSALNRGPPGHTP